MVYIKVCVCVVKGEKRLEQYHDKEKISENMYNLECIDRFLGQSIILLQRTDIIIVFTDVIVVFSFREHPYSTASFMY
jgi:hypothetical protein